MRGGVEVEEKLSDGCNLLLGSVIGRVAGVMVLGGHDTPRSVPNGLHILLYGKITRPPRPEFCCESKPLRSPSTWTLIGRGL